MTGWEIDELVSNARARAWEELNAPDPCEKQMEAAAKHITEATEFINIVEDKLAEAMSELYDTPMEAKVGSFLDDIEELRIDLNFLAEKYRKGER